MKTISKHYLVHRLVAKEFIANPNDKTEVDHTDHDPKNNCINNMRWSSKSENQRNMSKLKNHVHQSSKVIILIQKTETVSSTHEQLNNNTHWLFFI